MLLNKKYLYLGVSLFSAIILNTLATQNVKADALTGTPPVSTTTAASTTTTATPAPTKNTVTTTSNVPTNVVAPSNQQTKPSSTNAITTSTTSDTQTSTTSSTTTAGSTPISANNPQTTATIPTTATASTPYAIPSNVTNDTVVNFTDSNLALALKYWLNVPYNQSLTVGEIKSYTGNNVTVSMANYELKHPNGPTSTAIAGSHISDEQSTPVESLNGLQYLQLLPAKTNVTIQAMLASDVNANEDLTPLNNLNLSSINLGGNFSNPNAKEIDISQINKLNLSNASNIALEGSTATDGINQQELNEIAPTLNKYANNGQSFNMIEFDNSSISDFTPLKGTETGTSVMIDAVSNTIVEPTPAYAVNGQPITFLASKVLDPNGTDLSNKYTFSTSVTNADIKDDNLTNTGGDNYLLNNPDPTATTLNYGNYGFAYSYQKDSATMENLGNTYFENVNTIVQPLIWQTQPTITINYVDNTGKAITVNGSPLTKTLSGTTIGSPYDLTTASHISGYQLASPLTSLRGNYTEKPQTINLVYNPIPVTTTSKKVNPPRTKTKKIRKVISATRRKVKLVTENNYKDIGVKATTTINGQTFYLLDDGEFIQASSYNTVTEHTNGIIRTLNQPASLYDANGQILNIDLEPNTAWKYDQIVAIKGQAYYRVATNKYLPVNTAIVFIPITTATDINLSRQTTIYNSQGQPLPRTLPAKSTWKTDGYIIINGTKLYRVATNEYIKYPAQL